MQRGRKPTLTVVPIELTGARPRLTAPSLLTKGEREIFAEAAAMNPHLRPADSALLAAYAQALAKSYSLAQQSDAIASWEKTTRVVIALARSLRITSKSQVHPEAAGRKRQSLPPSYYETMESNDDRS
jgi:hypothetical protein